MGCDGGTIPRRDELVKTKKKPEKIERDIENAAKWKYCALTQSPLKEPIVACYLGRLYNKESVIEALLAKNTAENENTKHIRSLKDIKTLNLTKNPSFDATKADRGDDYKDHNVSQFICPVAGIEMNGKYRFCVVWSCGCVVSEKALKEVKSEVCHKCGKPCVDNDYIVLNGTDEEVEECRNRRIKKRDGDQASKTKKQANDNAECNGNDDDSKPSTSGLQKSTNNSSLKRANDSTSSKKTEIEIANGSSAAKKSKSIQEDPNASKVFKSLFTTSEAAKNQPKAHWVTHNPLYY